MRAAPSLLAVVTVSVAALLGGTRTGAAQPADKAGAAVESRVHAGNPFVRIPTGEHIPFYGDGTPVRIETFEMQRDLVSVGEYRRFLEQNPQWQRGRIASAFADGGYLRDWRGAAPRAEQPVVNVSWFTARAYCSSIGGRLPTVAEWEYVGVSSESQRDASGDAAHRAELLRRYTAARAELPAVGSGAANWYGIRGMHGPVRELVLDFNSVMVTDDSRSSTGIDRGLYCAASAAVTRDASDYAAYLRYALRGSMSARSTVGTMGFRCAR